MPAVDAGPSQPRLAEVAMQPAWMQSPFAEVPALDTPPSKSTDRVDLTEPSQSSIAAIEAANAEEARAELDAAKAKVNEAKDAVARMCASKLEVAWRNATEANTETNDQQPRKVRRRKKKLMNVSMFRMQIRCFQLELQIWMRVVMTFCMWPSFHGRSCQCASQ